MGTTKGMRVRRVVAAVATASTMMLASVAVAGAVPNSGSGTVGKPCTVTAGPNKGKSGTYTNDVDGLNCAGSWGSTACTGAGGAKQCKDKKAAMVQPGGPTLVPSMPVLSR